MQAITEWSETFGRDDAAAARGRAMRTAGRAWAAEHLSFERFQDRLAALAARRDDGGGE
jgi:hypothetical protein